MEKWLNDIRNRMKDYGQEPPKGLWENLNAHLEQERWQKKNAQRTSPWLSRTWGAGVAACIALALMLTYRYMPEPVNKDAHTYAAVTEDITAPVTQARGSHDTTIGTPSKKHTLAMASVPMKAATAAGEESVPEEGTAMEEVAVAAATSSEKTTTDEEAEKAVLSSVRTKQGNKISHTLRGNHTLRAAGTGSVRPRLNLAAYTSGSTGTEMSRLSMNLPPVMALGPDNVNWKDSPGLGMAVYNQGKVTEHKIRHNLPVRVGASVTYDLTDRLALGSGLTYTLLRSHLREGTESNYTKSEQNLHYMGIPFTLKYTFLRVKELSVYAQGGALAELRISGKNTRDYVLDGKKQGEDTERISSHPLQMSVNLAAGVQYNLTRTLAIYAEPGVSHYFKDGSSIPTIYKEKPTNFNLNVGLRFCIGK